jgi:FMN phosphatase YigB (HAD superfamily)
MIYVFDLDGTLCETDGMNYRDAKPIRERVAHVNRLYEQGHTIYIDTARGSETEIDWAQLTRDQLAVWGVQYHRLRAGVKIFGHVYVDDRAINAHEFFACES